VDGNRTGAAQAAGVAVPTRASATGCVAPAAGIRAESRASTALHPTEAMPKTVTAERLAERICRRLGLCAADHAETLSELLREALTEVREATITATRAVCLEVAEDEAERCRSAGASAAQQTALNIAARIRRRHINA